MRQIVKRVKSGQEIKFICSACGEIVHSIFILAGDSCEINWDKLPERCSCGARLTNRQPIIDANDLDMNNTSGSVRKNIHGNVCDNFRRDVQRSMSRDISGNPDVYRRCMIDLENAVSIDYFDMRLSGLKRGNCKIPDNIDHLMAECIKRNISYIESCMERSSYEEDENEKDENEKDENEKDENEKDENEKDELKERLNTLRQRYSDTIKKSEDKKDFEKKKRSSTTV